MHTSKIQRMGLLECKWSIGETTQSCPYFHSSVCLSFTLPLTGSYSNVLLQIIPASRKQKAVDWSNTAETHYSTVLIPEKFFDVSRTQNNRWCNWGNLWIMAGLFSCSFFIKLGRKQLLFLYESGLKDVRNSFTIGLLWAQPCRIITFFLHRELFFLANSG